MGVHMVSGSHLRVPVASVQNLPVQTAPVQQSSLPALTPNLPQSVPQSQNPQDISGSQGLILTIDGGITLKCFSRSGSNISTKSTPTTNCSNITSYVSYDYALDPWFDGFPYQVIDLFRSFHSGPESNFEHGPKFSFGPLSNCSNAHFCFRFVVRLWTMIASAKQINHLTMKSFKHITGPKFGPFSISYCLF